MSSQPTAKPADEKKPSDIYSVTDNGTNVVIVFTESITLSPGDIVNTDFSVKGKIVSR